MTNLNSLSAEIIKGLLPKDFEIFKRVQLQIEDTERKMYNAGSEISNQVSELISEEIQRLVHEINKSNSDKANSDDTRRITNSILKYTTGKSFINNVADLIAKKLITNEQPKLLPESSNNMYDSSFKDSNENVWKNMEDIEESINDEPFEETINEAENLNKHVRKDKRPGKRKRSGQGRFL